MKAKRLYALCDAHAALLNMSCVTETTADDVHKLVLDAIVYLTHLSYVKKYKAETVFVALSNATKVFIFQCSDIDSFKATGYQLALDAALGNLVKTILSEEE